PRRPRALPTTFRRPSTSITWLSCIFFFSSRRRHTRSLRDWSSDVCSSDLVALAPFELSPPEWRERDILTQAELNSTGIVQPFERSEERRVGKEGRCGWGREQ